MDIGAGNINHNNNNNRNNNHCNNINNNNNNENEENHCETQSLDSQDATELISQQQQQLETAGHFVEAMDTQDSDIRIENFTTTIIAAYDDNNMQIGPIMNPISSTISPEIMEASSTTTTDDPQIDEEVRSEATFTFTVENFSKLKDSVLSPPCYVRNLPWKIMVMPRIDRNQQDSKSLGFFLQCNGESESTNWTCNAVAELRLKSFKSGQEPFVRKIKHLFYSKENDWGFSYFMSWNDILDPEKEYVKNDTIILEVHVAAEAPHGVFWDSKKLTGFVGLKNQGATCYMNSLLQTLYFTNQFRKAVYKMPTEYDDSSKSVALALQRVFHELQFSDKPVGTKKLTKSFGWETLDSFMQHDVQEFLRVLLDKVETKMKGTNVEGTVPSLFEGKMSSYIKCKNVNYESTRVETFYDIQLNIKGKRNIYESFADYIEPETLDGDNKYDAGIHGLQEAEKGVKFISFPPVLHLHLMRFQYDPITDNSVKFNDRFEFDEKINLDKFLSESESTPAEYKLHAVLVHSGDNHGGHYVVYINPKGDGKWCKFDDDVVSTCTITEAIEHNYGGIDDELNLSTKHCSNAYMLVYIRKSAILKVLEEITLADIPTELSEKLTEEKRMEQAKRRERSEAGSFIIVPVILEESFEIHHSSELFDLEKIHHRIFRLKRTQTVADLILLFVEAFKITQNRMRLWPFIFRPPVYRPVYFDINEEYKQLLSNIVDTQNTWIIFLELASPEKPDLPFPIFDMKKDILLFFKFYDPYVKKLNYIGYGQYSLEHKLNDLILEINIKLGFPLDNELTVYEERCPSNIQRLLNLNETLKNALKGPREEVQGNILIFERKILDDKLELSTCAEYFVDLLCRFEVNFIDKMNPNEPGFRLQISNRNTYEQIVQAVAEKINTDPNKIQFIGDSLSSGRHKDQPNINPLKSIVDGYFKDMINFNNKQRTLKKIYFQRLSMNIHELENKKQFKCLWVSQNLKDEKELILYPNKNGTVKTLLEEAAKQIEFSDDSSRKLRLLEISSHKLLQPPSPDIPLESLQCGATDSVTNQANYKYRIEEIPSDELLLDENEMLIPVSHFNKEIYNSFGAPFLIKIRQDELFGSLKERLQKKLNVPDKEWEKYKFAIISMNKVNYITEESTPINLDDFKYANQQPSSPLPHLGLEHFNKFQKRSRYNYLEKAIKIYN